MFSKEKVNCGRQIELDVAKTIAIFFMIIVHVYEVYCAPVYSEGVAARIFEFFGSPTAAPVFMFLLGVGLVYTRKTDASMFAKRGIFLLGLGYVLNFVRDYVPYMLLANMTGDPEYAVEAWDSLFGVDILMFAGLTFLFFSIVKKLNLKDSQIALTWVGIGILNTFLKGIYFEQDWMNKFFGLFWGTDDYSWFPFVTWIAYPIAGYFFAKVLVHCTNKDLLYKKIFVGAGSLSVLFWYVAYVDKIDYGAFGAMYQESYYQHGIISNLILITFVLFWLSCIYFLTKMCSEEVLSFFVFMSKNNTKYYCIHWIILGYSMLILELEAFDPLALLGISLGIYLTVHYIIVLNDLYKKSRELSQTIPTQNPNF